MTDPLQRKQHTMFGGGGSYHPPSTPTTPTPPPSEPSVPKTNVMFGGTARRRPNEDELMRAFLEDLQQQQRALVGTGRGTATRPELQLVPVHPPAAKKDESDIHLPPGVQRFVDRTKRVVDVLTSDHVQRAIDKFDVHMTSSEGNVLVSLGNTALDVALSYVVKDKKKKK